MKQNSYSTSAEGLTTARVWELWSDVNRWHTWQCDIAYARMEGPFQAGNSFYLKPRGGPKVKIEILRAEKNVGFTDLTRFPLARMYGDHRFVQKKGAVELTTTMRMEGPLGFLWRRLVMNDIVRGLPDQTAGLIEAAMHGQKETAIPARKR